MKKYLFIVFLIVSSTGISQKLPKSCIGEYAGEMASYSVIKNDIEMQIEKHDVRVAITSTQIIYYTGSITVKGDYNFFKQNKTEYLIKANFSNGKSLSYDMEFLWDKKDKTIRITGKNGEPDVKLEKLDN